MKFNKMSKLPKRAMDLSGNLEEFSVPVLVYGQEDPIFCEIGHYNFDTKKWVHFGDNSMKLICWCYLPNPTKFLVNNNLEPVLHNGYR